MRQHTAAFEAICASSAHRLSHEVSCFVRREPFGTLCALGKLEEIQSPPIVCVNDRQVNWWAMKQDL